MKQREIMSVYFEDLGEDLGDVKEMMQELK